MNHFSPPTRHRLKNYVYALVDPRTNLVFYVGKGLGNRCFNHLIAGSEQPKGKQINEIKDAGLKVKIYILTDGWDTKAEAHKLETPFMQLFKIGNFDMNSLGGLTNLVSGHHVEDWGIRTVEEVEARYNPEERRITEEDFTDGEALIVKLSKSYKLGGDTKHAAQYAWRVCSKRIKNVKYVMAVYKGIIMDVFEPESWHIVEKQPSKHYWLGDRTLDQKVLDKYVGRVWPWNHGANPIQYVGV